MNAYRSTFGAETVNALRRMILRHYQRPHCLTCITDDAAGVDPEVRVIPLWDTFSSVPSPHGAHFPSCFRRLPLFGPYAEELIGPRFVCLDLDVVIVADVAPLWDRTEDFVGLRDPLYPRQLNGSMWLLKAGSCPEVWTDFNPIASPQLARRAGFFGSDQAYLSYKLPDMPTWGREDGVYSYRRDIEASGRLPENARVVICHGQHDPWGQKMQRLQWCREHWGDASG